MPLTVAVQVLVWAVVIVDGEQFTPTDVIVDDAAVTATFDDPDFVVSWVDVAVIVAVPAQLGVNTPAFVTVPPAAVQVTAEL